MNVRKRHATGSPWEDRVGFSRAVRVGDRIVISGTAPLDDQGALVGEGDARAQAARCLEIVLEAIRALGGVPQDLVRTRIYLVSADDAEAVGRAHAEVLSEVRPASTMVVVGGLLDPAWRVEIEAEAVVSDAFAL